MVAKFAFRNNNISMQMIIKIVLSLIVVLLFVATSMAQSRAITADEYNGNVNGAVSVTNAAFPFTYSVTTDFINNGKVVRSESETNERESDGHERMRKIILADGKKTNIFQITVGLGNVYCSDDGVSWKPPTQYECPGPDKFLMLTYPRAPESAEYTVQEKALGGKKVSVYRKFALFAPSTPNGKKEFEEEIATIDSGGFFINVINTTGTLDPRTVTKVTKESWDTKTKIKPVVAPIR